MTPVRTLALASLAVLAAASVTACKKDEAANTADNAAVASDNAMSTNDMSGGNMMGGNEMSSNSMTNSPS